MESVELGTWGAMIERRGKDCLSIIAPQLPKDLETYSRVLQLALETLSPVQNISPVLYAQAQHNPN